MVDIEKFPDKICQACLKQLQQSYNFQVQFKETGKLLEENIGDVSIKDKVVALADTLPVELICGSQSYDLRNIIVVENEENGEKARFDGFLRNLGSEISAFFVTKQDDEEQLASGNCKIAICSKSTPNESQSSYNFPIDDYIDTSTIQLGVRKLPEESIILIESNTNNVKTIVKTLYECQTCSKLFKEQQNFLKHTDVCPPIFICEQCGHVTHSTSALYHHRQKHKGRRFRCSVCNKTFITTSRLKDHLEIHKNKRSYLCNHCGKSFNYSLSLKYHLRIHTGEKSFVCNYCGLKYRARSILQRHLRTHTLARPYLCQYCPKSFQSRGEQKAHEMLHTGDRPYRCEYCNKAFIRKSTLNSHCLTHEGLHPCHFCTKTFIEMKFLRLHLKSSHRFVNK